MRVLAGWVQHHGANLVTLYPPGGGGRIRIFERLRPLQRASQVIARVLATDPGFKTTQVGKATPLTTSEGELGLWIDLQGNREGAAVRRGIAMIFADEFVVAFDVLAIEPTVWDTVDTAARRLVAGHQLGLGIRQRRFIYTPPAGWTSLARGLVAYHYPPDFPRDPSLLVVHPAIPAPELSWDPPPRALIEELTDGFDRHDLVDRPHPMLGGSTARHLIVTGQAARAPTQVVRHAVVQYAAPYLYVARYDQPASAAASEELPSVLASVVQSMVPVPDAQPRVIPRASASTVLDHWAD